MRTEIECQIEFYNLQCPALRYRMPLSRPSYLGGGAAIAIAVGPHRVACALAMCVQFSVQGPWAVNWYMIQIRQP
jgi:hypothetical protein